MVAESLVEHLERSRKVVKVIEAIPALPRPHHQHIRAVRIDVRTHSADAAEYHSYNGPVSASNLEKIAVPLEIATEA